MVSKLASTSLLFKSAYLERNNNNEHNKIGLYLYFKAQASVCSVLMILIPQNMLRIRKKDFKCTKEDFRLQTAHLKMSSDTVAILDASQTYKTTIRGGLDGLTNWFQF